MIAFLKNIRTVLFSILVTFIVLEVFARIWLFNFTDEKTFRTYASLQQLQSTDWNQQFKFTYHRYLGNYPTPNYVEGKNRHNSLGYRGEDFPIEKPAGEYRIVCIGGSTTYTSFIEDYRLSYPALLEEKLKSDGFNQVRVINAGVGGWRSWESLVNLQFRVLDLNPDLIVIYHAVNDVNSRLVWPAEAYRGDNSGQLRPHFSRIFMPSILEHSTLFRALLIRAGLQTPHTAVNRVAVKNNKEHNFSQAFLKQRRNGSYPQGLFTEIPAMEILKTNQPIYFERNLNSMIHIARANDVDVMLATFAFMSEGFERFPKSASPEFIHALNEHNAVIRKLGERNQVAVFDFASLFPANPDNYLDGHHVNEAGARLKAQLFGDYIEDYFLSSPPGPVNTGP